MNSNFSLLKIINGLSRTINIANQMLPLYNQIKPIISNGSKLLSNINLPTLQKQNNNTVTTNTKQIETPIQTENNLPTFFQ